MIMVENVKYVEYSTTDLFHPARAAAKDQINCGTITIENIESLEGKIPNKVYIEAKKILIGEVKK